MHDGDAIKARGRECQVERGRDVGSAHRGTKPPSRDVTREVVEHGRQVVPAPTSDLQVGKIRLPELVDGGGLVLELVCRLDHHIGRAGDQVMRFQQPIDRSLRDKILLLVGEPNGQLSRRQLWELQRQVDDLAADIVRDAIPDAVRS